MMAARTCLSTANFRMATRLASQRANLHISSLHGCDTFSRSPSLPIFITRHCQQQQAFLSTTSPPSSSFSFSPLEWWRGRQERNEATKYKERLNDMAQKEKWTVGDMQNELKEVEKSWLAKIQDSAEIRQAKQMSFTVNGIVSVMGVDATDELLSSMTRTQKLQAAAHTGVGVEQVNMLIQQFQTMGLMHRVLRQRQSLGKSIPTTPEAMQSIMQVEGPKLMNAAHKKSMVQTQQKRMKRALGQRRR
ncbi:hypothetical protein MPSEU_000344900 [Mayamaea pseudoterrestris]|nr:hypothetical protein MPSEU_000344900 [Mayamaea pseudoterrestris]